MLGTLVVDVKRNLRKLIFEKTLKLGLAYSQLFKTQELIHLSVDNVEQLEVYFGGFLTQFITAIDRSCILSTLIVSTLNSSDILAISSSLFHLSHIF